MKREIEIDKTTCHYIEYLHNSVMAYENVIKDLITEIRGKININEKRFNKFCEDYRLKYFELEALKQETYENYFSSVYTDEVKFAKSYSIDFLNSSIVVELGDEHV